MHKKKQFYHKNSFFNIYLKNVRVIIPPKKSILLRFLVFPSGFPNNDRFLFIPGTITKGMQLIF